MLSFECSKKMAAQPLCAVNAARPEHTGAVPLRPPTRRTHARSHAAREIVTHDRGDARFVRSFVPMMKWLREGAIALEELLMGSCCRVPLRDGRPMLEALPVDLVGQWCLDCGRTIRSRASVLSVGCDACMARVGAALDHQKAQGNDGESLSNLASGPCRANSAAPWPLVRLGRYEGVLRRGVLRAKYGDVDGVAVSAGRQLGEQWLRVMAALESQGHGAPIWFRHATVQPVPMPWLRRMERGGDHALQVAKGFAAVTQLPVQSLVRQRWRGPQARLSGAERRRLHSGDEASAAHRGKGEHASARSTRTPPNRFVPRQALWQQIIAIAPRTLLPDRRAGAMKGDATMERAVILVDDVRTSGETLRQLAQSLLATGFAHIGAAVLAVSHDLPARGLGGVRT